MTDKTSQRSGELFDSGFWCAESVLLAVAESKGIESDLIPKIASGFCAGISRTNQLCGALSGAIMAINLLYGRSKPDESMDKNRFLVQEMIEMFKDKFGSTNCRELTGCDLETEEGYKLYYSNNLNIKCRNFVTEAVSMAILLIEQGEF